MQYGTLRFSIHAAAVNSEFSWVLLLFGYGLALENLAPKSQNTSLKKGEILTSEWIVYKHLAPSVKLPKTYHEKRLYHYWMNLECMKHSLRISCFYSLFRSFSYSQHYNLCWFFFPGCDLPKIKKNQKCTASGSDGATVPLWHQSLLNSQFQEDSQHLYRTHATSDVPRSPYHCSFQTQMPA